MRIAHVTEASVAGVNGIASSIRLLAGELRGRGHETLIATAGPSVDGAVSVFSFSTGMGDYRGVPFPLSGLRRLVRPWRPDLLHLHTCGPLGAGALALGQELGIPAVYTAHTDMHSYARHYYIPGPFMRFCTRIYGRHLPSGLPLPPGGSWHQRAVERAEARIYAAADLVVAPTEAALRHCTTIDRAKVRVAPTPAVDRPGNKGFRERHGIPETARVVLFVGRLSAEKGIPLLLDAYVRLRAQVPETVLVLVGPGRLSKRTGDGVVTGPLPPGEVRAAYEEADVFAFPSLTDTQGIVLHEAALAGLPIVMVDRELHAAHPLRDVVRLATPTPNDLATTLKEAMGTALNPREVARELTPERFGGRMLEIYQEALKTRGGRG